MPTGFENIQIAGGDTAQPLAMQKRLRVIRPYLKPGGNRFLDCGCGAGSYVLALLQSFCLDAHGIEFSEEKVQTAWSNPLLRERIRQGDLQAIDSPPESWDYAMLNEVLEHVPNEAKALAEVRRILKPQGVLFVFSPNRWFPFETHGVKMKKSGKAVYWIPFIPYIPLPLGSTVFEYWARNYWQSELARLLTNAGFRIVEKGFVWQTFEGISHHQPPLVTKLRGTLRAVSNALEKTPLLRRFGVSQVLVCAKRA